ncbi:MAG: hypothetical protein M1826_005034 [Phylliscum demangeonii]|nr:MAG: hypothetical protein M1826_005034 [Phylliscum demangeonii]
MSADAVEAVTNSLANVSVQDPPANGDKAPDSGNYTTDASMVASAEGRRLYIGNLAYATTEGELKEFFKDFSLETATIPHNPRSERPVGYGFVDMTSAAEAERAIAELGGKEILERKVSVQYARKPDERNLDENGEHRRPYGRGRVRGGRVRGRGRGGFRGGRSRNAENGEAGEADGENQEASSDQPGQETPLTDATNEGGADKGDKNEAEGTAEAGTDAAKQDRSRGPPRRRRGPPEDGIASKTKVMVANLPYDFTEEQLLELFHEYEPANAKLALRPIPRFMVRKLQARNEPRKGRGFGFVTLGSEEQQLKAVKEMHGKPIGGREIAVKIAIDSPGKEDDGNGQGQAPAEGPGEGPGEGQGDETADAHPGEVEQESAHQEATTA